jgi:hypothetical protein
LASWLEPWLALCTTAANTISIKLSGSLSARRLGGLKAGIFIDLFLSWSLFCSWRLELANQSLYIIISCPLMMLVTRLILGITSHDTLSPERWIVVGTKSQIRSVDWSLSLIFLVMRNLPLWLAFISIILSLYVRLSESY